MNRHHPYAGGGYDGPPNRRGGPPGGFGPDRTHRFSDRGGPSRGRGGFRGGRGGGGGPYGGYDSGVAAYDQGPPQGDTGGYNSYESSPPQDSFYSGNFNGRMQGQYGPPPDGGDYDEGYGNYEGAPEDHVESLKDRRKQGSFACLRVGVGCRDE